MGNNVSQPLISNNNDTIKVELPQHIQVAAGGATRFAAKQGVTSGVASHGRAGLQSAIRMSTALNATPDGTNDEPSEEIEVQKNKIEELKEDPKFSNYSWVVLALIVAVRIVYQW